jgi:hypothetical protein
MVNEGRRRSAHDASNPGRHPCSDVVPAKTGTQYTPLCQWLLDARLCGHDKGEGGDRRCQPGQPIPFNGFFGFQ